MVRIQEGLVFSARDEIWRFEGRVVLNLNMKDILRRQMFLHVSSIEAETLR